MVLVTLLTMLAFVMASTALLLDPRHKFLTV
jgi:hypothetical protein